MAVANISLLSNAVFPLVLTHAAILTILILLHTKNDASKASSALALSFAISVVIWSYDGISFSV